MMKKIIKNEVSYIICDITNKIIQKSGEMKDYCTINIPLYIQDGEGECEGAIEYLELDLSNQIGYEIYNFLKKKYSKKIENNLQKTLGYSKPKVKKI